MVASYATHLTNATIELHIHRLKAAVDGRLLYVGIAIVAVVVVAATRGRLGYTAPTTGAATPMAVDRAVPITAPDGTW